MFGSWDSNPGSTWSQCGGVPVESPGWGESRDSDFEAVEIQRMGLHWELR